MPSSVLADAVSHAANATATPYQPEFKKLSFYLARNEVALQSLERIALRVLVFAS
jgi:hypothetical protein